jgi:hypothetical protein
MNKRTTVGIQANRAEKLGDGEDGQRWRVYPNEILSALPGIKVGTVVHRNRDHQWEAALTKKSSERKVALHLALAESAGGLRLTLRDEDGIVSTTEARARAAAGAAGGTGRGGPAHESGQARQHDVRLRVGRTGPLAAVVRALFRHQRAAPRCGRGTRAGAPGRVGTPAAQGAGRAARRVSGNQSQSYLANVYNEKARAFYHKHGVELIAAAYEAHEEAGEVPLMITKHCLRFSFNLCPKQAKGVQGVQGQVRAEPMTLVTGDERYTLKFDCKPCEMHVVGAIKPGILHSPPPSAVPVSPLVFHRQRPRA